MQSCEFYLLHTYPTPLLFWNHLAPMHPKTPAPPFQAILSPRRHDSAVFQHSTYLLFRGRPWLLSSERATTVCSWRWYCGCEKSIRLSKDCWPTAEVLAATHSHLIRVRRCELTLAYLLHSSQRQICNQKTSSTNHCAYSPENNGHSGFRYS